LWVASHGGDLLAGSFTHTELPCSLDLTYARNAAIGMAYSVYSSFYAEALSTGHSNKHTTLSVCLSVCLSDHQDASFFLSYKKSSPMRFLLLRFQRFISRKGIYLQYLVTYIKHFVFSSSIPLHSASPFHCIVYKKKRQSHMLIYAVLPDKAV